MQHTQSFGKSQLEESRYRSTSDNVITLYLTNPLSANHAGIDTANAHVDLTRNITFHRHCFILYDTVVVGTDLIVYLVFI
jgi:hypothetical protein